MLLQSLALIKIIITLTVQNNCYTTYVSEAAATKVQSTEKCCERTVEQKDPSTATASSEKVTSAENDKQGLPLPEQAKIEASCPMSTEVLPVIQSRAIKAEPLKDETAREGRKEKG